MENLKVYTGGDVTKMPRIGVVKTRPIGGFGPAEYGVVGVLDERGGLVYVCDSWYKEHKRIPQLVHSGMVDEFIPASNENTSATGGPSVGGMGDVVNAQPSGLAGQTIGISWASGGGKAGSGDVSIPYNPSGSNRVFQKLPVAAMGVEHGAMTGKKSRVKRLSRNAIKDIFAKRQDFTAGQGKVMNFQDFLKGDTTKVKESFGMSRSECERCGGDTGGVTMMSIFNLAVVCRACKADERLDPYYKLAVEAEAAAVSRGEYNYPGLIPNYRPIPKQ